MLYSLLQLIFSIFFKLFFRAEIYGRENMPKDGAVILAANHMSNWDPPFVATFLHRPVSYMAKIELFKNPIFGRAITACHAFPVKRGAADRGGGAGVCGVHAQRQTRLFAGLYAHPPAQRLCILRLYWSEKLKVSQDIKIYCNIRILWLQWLDECDNPQFCHLNRR